MAYKQLRAEFGGSNRSCSAREVLFDSEIAIGGLGGFKGSSMAVYQGADLAPEGHIIVQLFGEGRAIKQIADLLRLSEKTVEFHKHQITEAFNLKKTLTSGLGIPPVARPIRCC
jgi:DNA-binding NarL/FixJ family response regulator